MRIPLSLALVQGLLGWPKFSVTSFTMISNLRRQGIIPKTVIDVGANAGQFAVAAAKLFGDVEVHSFEPHPECVQQLRKNVASLPNIHVYAVPLGRSEAAAEFYLNSHTHSSSFLHLSQNHRSAFPHAEEVNTLKVRMTSLDAVFGEKRLAGPVLLKLDVQGYEGEVLAGGAKVLRAIDYVVLEASLKPMYEGEMLFTELLKVMEGHGFSFLRPIGMLSDPRNGEVLQLDALFQRRQGDPL